jgi:hypothetical protein
MTQSLSVPVSSHSLGHTSFKHVLGFFRLKYPIAALSWPGSHNFTPVAPDTDQMQRNSMCTDCLHDALPAYQPVLL